MKKGKPTPKPTGYLTRLQRKPSRVDYDTFNFLENLIIFNSVSASSFKDQQTRFHISRQPSPKEFIAVFSIDKKNGLFPNEDKRPDYLTLYIDSQKCLITIIEMKKSNPDDAVDQILALYRKLKPEVERCFRFGTKVIYQGLILSKKLTDGADAKMKKTTELTIRPLRSERSHDIYPYISQELKGSNKVNSEKRNTLSEPQKESLEAIFQRSLHTRIEDTYWTANRPRKDKDGVYINFIISDEAYAILHSEGKNTSLLTSTSHCDTIQNQLSQLRPQSKISVETLTE